MQIVRLNLDDYLRLLWRQDCRPMLHGIHTAHRIGSQWPGNGALQLVFPLGSGYPVHYF